MPRYYDDDGYYDEPPRPQRPRMSSNMSGNVYHLHPDPYVTGTLHRTRSVGHARAPDVTIYNDLNARADPVMMAPPSPRGRPVALYDGGYVEYQRSHSRGSSYGRSSSTELAIAEYRREQEEIEREKKRAIVEYEAKKKEAAEKEKEAKEAAVRKWKEDEAKKKLEEKEAEEAAVRKWQEEEKKKKDKKEKEEEEYRARVRRDLLIGGIPESRINAVLKLGDEKTHHHHITDGTIAIRGGRPVYPKIRRADIAVETLKYYDLQWEYDSLDKDYIIILREMSERETDILFEHTRRLRDRTTLTIQDRGKEKPEYAWVRRRSRSGKSPKRERLAEKLFLG